MKQFSHISFNIPREKDAELLAFLESEGLRSGWAPPPTPMGLSSFHLRLEADDLRLAVLISLLQRERINWFEQREHVYEIAELLAFPLLRLGVAGRSVDGGLPQKGTLYDVSNACKRCGTGAVQTSSLTLQRSQVPKTGHLKETHRGHLLIGEGLMEAFRADEIAGAEFRQACLCKTGDPVPWWQVICKYTLPRMSPQAKGVVRDTGGCPVCERDMYCGTPDHPCEFAYDVSAVDHAALPDIVQTWECFGRSVLHDDPERHLIRGFAQPDILIKPRVMELLMELKVKHVRFQPVRFV